MKRIFTIIMMVCLLAGALSITAFAADGVVLTVSGLTKDGTPIKIEDYTSFETGWNFAMDKAKDREYLDTNEYDRIVVDLLTDWKANKKGEFGDSDGVGFRQSTIYVPDSARVMLNMNGHTIDRGLGDNNELDGEVICIEEKSDVIINGGKNGDAIVMADVEKTTAQFGTIKGGNSDNGAGGIHIQDDARVTLNNVKIVGNVADGDDGGGIAMYDNASLIMNGGGFLDNKNDTYDKGNGAAIYIYGSTAKFNKVLFSNNQFTYKSGHGAAIGSVSDSVIEVNDCKFINNGNWDEDAGAKGSLTLIDVYGGKIDIKNSVFEGNGSPEQNQYWGSDTRILGVGAADLTMDNCTFTKNHANGYVIDNGAIYDDFVVYNSTFTNNDCGVFDGDTGEFINCTFDQNGGTYTFGGGEYYRLKVTLRDCNLGNSTFEDVKNVEIVDTDAENGIASIFSQGSLTMIVSILSLIASGVAIFLVVYYNKKKAVPVAANSVAETENDEEE